MSKKHDQNYYLKQCRKCLLQIKMTPSEEGFVFLRLKKKAEKYLAKAKEFEKEE